MKIEEQIEALNSIDDHLYRAMEYTRNLPFDEDVSAIRDGIIITMERVLYLRACILTMEKGA